jgi:hypothetical protein
METINVGRRWVVNKIMSYMRKYFTSISFENIQVFDPTYMLEFIVLIKLILSFISCSL